MEIWKNRAHSSSACFSFLHAFLYFILRRLFNIASAFPVEQWHIPINPTPREVIVIGINDTRFNCREKFVVNSFPVIALEKLQ